MTGLAEEIRADQDPRQHCGLCSYLETLTPTEQKEWDAVLADRSLTKTSIVRALTRRNSGVKRGSVENHTANGHRGSR